MKITRKPYGDLVRERIQNRLGGSQKWYEISNAASDEAEIRIFDEIGWFGVTADAFVAELDAITAPKILVRVSSIGGDVFDAVTITNALRLHPAFVTTRVEGVAASAASFITMAGDHRQILDSGQVFVHSAWGLVVGDATDMRQMADLLERQNNVIANIYADRTDRPVAEWLSVMDDETWFTAEEAVEAGLADEIVKPSKSDAPADRAPQRFTDHLRAVVTAVEEVSEETENVVTFRSTQGKTPLSEDAAALLADLAAATSRLAAIAEEPDPESDEDSVDAEYLRFVDLTIN